MQHSALEKFLSNLVIFNTDGAIGIIPPLLSEARIVWFEAATRIIAESQSSNDCGYIILQGSVSVSIEQEQIATLGVGDIFGEYAPIAGRDRTATVVALTHTTCLVIKKWILLRLVAAGSWLNNIILRRIKENKKYNRGVFRAHP